MLPKRAEKTHLAIFVLLAWPRISFRWKACRPYARPIRSTAVTPVFGHNLHRASATSLLRERVPIITTWFILYTRCSYYDLIYNVEDRGMFIYRRSCRAVCGFDTVLACSDWPERPSRNRCNLVPASMTSCGHMQRLQRCNDATAN